MLGVRSPVGHGDVLHEGMPANLTTPAGFFLATPGEAMDPCMAWLLESDGIQLCATRAPSMLPTTDLGTANARWL